MPTPPITNVLPDPVLSLIAVELGHGAPFIADMIAPPATVPNDSFKFATYGREELLESVNSQRAPGVAATELKLSQTFTPGVVDYFSLKNSIPDEVMNNSPNPSALEGRRVRALTINLMLGVERRIEALVQAATQTFASTSDWGAAADTVRLDIINATETFRRLSGFFPTHLVIPPVVRPAFVNSDDVKELLKHNQPQNLIAESNITTYERMTVVYPGMIENLENPGATGVNTDIWAQEEAYLLYVDATAGDDLGAATALRQVRSNARTGADLSAYRWRDADASAHTNWVAVDINQKEVTVSDPLILTITGVLSA